MLTPTHIARSLAGIVLSLQLTHCTTGLGAVLSLDGTHVVPRLQSTEMRSRQKPDFSLGARVEVFLRNTSANTLTIPVSTDIRLRGQTPRTC